MPGAHGTGDERFEIRVFVGTAGVSNGGRTGLPSARFKGVRVPAVRRPAGARWSRSKGRSRARRTWRTDTTALGKRRVFVAGTRLMSAPCGAAVVWRARSTGGGRPGSGETRGPSVCLPAAGRPRVPIVNRPGLRARVTIMAGTRSPSVPQTTTATTITTVTTTIDNTMTTTTEPHRVRPAVPAPRWVCKMDRRRRARIVVRVPGEWTRPVWSSSLGGRPGSRHRGPVLLYSCARVRTAGRTLPVRGATTRLRLSSGQLFLFLPSRVRKGFTGFVRVCSWM